MAFGLFRAVFNISGNAKGELSQIQAAMQGLNSVAVSSAGGIRGLGVELNRLSDVDATVQRFQQLAGGLSATNAQAAFLTNPLRELGDNLNTIGGRVTGLTPTMAKYTQEMARADQSGKDLSVANRRLAQTFFDLVARIRSLGTEGPITSGKLRSLSQEVKLLSLRVSGEATFNLQAFSQSLAANASQMRIAEQDARKFGSAITQITPSMGVAAAEAQKLAQTMLQIGTVGGFSSSQVLKLAQQMLVLATSADPVLSTSLRRASAELQAFGLSIAAAEQTARQAASTGGFQMMQDVSAGTQTRFRQLSAASQGLMISMALLQRNVMGLAFSLIFLQFSGFIKLSLFVAGLTATLGLAALSFRFLVKEGLRTERLSNAFFILSGSLEQFGLALDAARKIGKEFGLSRELVDALILLKREGIQPTNNELEALREGMTLLQQDAVPGVITSTDDLIDSFKKFLEDGKDVQGFWKDLVDNEGKWQEAAARADVLSLKDSRTELQKTIEEFGDLFGPTASRIAEWWENFKIGWVSFGSEVIKIMSGDINQAFKTLLWDPLITLFKASLKILNFIFGFMLIEPLKRIVNDTSKGINLAFSKMFNAIKGVFNFFGGVLRFAWKNTVGRLVDVVTDLVPKMFKGGQDLVVGLMQGIWSKANWIRQQAFNFAQSIFNSIRSGLGILWPFSPSEAGINIGEGLGLGIIAGIKAITNDVNRSVGSLTSGVVGGNLARPVTALTGRGGQSGITINVFNNDFSGTDPQRAGRTLATEILRGITRNSTITTAPLVP